MSRNIIPLLILSVLSVVGCSSTGRMKQPDFSALLPPGPPAKAVAAWEPAVRHVSGEETPQRGFGGRVYFYDQEAKRPIKVDGSIVVYAFDEDNRKSGDIAPSRSYYFAKDDLKKLHSKSKLGSSYNLWVPWDTDGADGKAKKISLIVRYIPEVGSSVVSSQAAVYLPGKRDQTEMMAKSEWERRQQDSGAIQQVAWKDGGVLKSGERLIESNDNRPLSIQTSTISIPHNLSQNMQTALSSPMPVAAASEIKPVAFLDEKPAETKPETVAERKEAFRREPSFRR